MPLHEITCAAYSGATRPNPHVIAPVATQLSPQPRIKRLIRRTTKQAKVLDCSDAAASRHSALSKPAAWPTNTVARGPETSVIRPAKGRVTRVATYCALIPTPAHKGERPKWK